MRRVKHGVRRVVTDVADKAETVLQPCAAGRAPHKPFVESDYFTTVCSVCGKDLS